MEKIKNIFLEVKKLALSHKIISVIILIVLISSPFVINQFLPKKSSVSYITQAVKKGNINVSISGTGQVSSLDDVSLTSEVSGAITGVYATNGKEVKRGDLLFKIDSSDGEKNLKSAQLALESAQLALEEMQQPTDELTLLQAENSLTSAQETRTKAEATLEKSYDDGYTTISNTFLDLPSVMVGLNDILFSDDLNINGSQQNIDFYASTIGYYDDRAAQYKKDAYDKYMAAKEQYEATIDKYKAVSRFSDDATIESLISETYDTTKSIAEAIRSANNLIELYKYVLSEKQQSYNAGADTNLTSLNGYTSKANNHLSNLLSAKNTITTAKESIVDADRSIKVNQLSLEKTKEGATDLEIRTQQLAVEQKQADLDDAQTTLAKYSVRAPFNGIVSAVNVSKGDNANSGTVLGSIITKEKIATITLNEVDIAKVKVGQKVNLTFDALDNLSVVGEVYEVDTVGTVSQGVVSYSVKISFAADNESIKPGMSVSANIITDSVSDVLVIPSSAVKTAGSKSFVEVMDANKKTERKSVEIGITDETSIEIKSGLTEGDKVVTGTTIKTTTKKTTTTTNKTNTTGNELRVMTNGGGMGGPGL